MQLPLQRPQTIRSAADNSLQFRPSAQGSCATDAETSPNRATSIQSNQPDEDDEERHLNTAEELGKGIINTRLKGSGEYTILLIGETGAGKTTFLSLLGNVLSGRAPDEYVLHHNEENEAGGSERHSQTNQARLYEFRSQNGVTVRILDTPGLADTRGLAQDNIHKASIAQAINNHISTVDAILILANGTLPRLGAATDYTLFTLSSFFPRSLVENIGLLFTNVSNPLLWNFDQEALPKHLRNEDRQFLLDNPIAMWKKYIDLRAQKNMKKAVLTGLKHSVYDGHRTALACLVSLFDWLDAREPQPTNEIVDLYEKSLELEQKIADFLCRARQLAGKKKMLEEMVKAANEKTLTMEQYQNYQTSITEKIWIQVPTPRCHTMCFASDCYSNCAVDRPLNNKMRSMNSLTHPASLGLCALGLGLGIATGGVGFALLGAGGLGAAAIHGVTEMVHGRQICLHCRHPDECHLYGRMKWQQEGKERIVIDTDAQQKHAQAMVENVRVEMKAQAHYAKTARMLDKELDACLNHVILLTEEYAEKSMSGRSTGQVRKAVVLLELTLEAMQNDGAEPTSLKKLEECLAKMKTLQE